MASNILQKEKEYYKLNEEIQNINKKLMTEFNTVLKKQDNLLKESTQNITNLDYSTILLVKDGSDQNTKDISFQNVPRLKTYSLSAKENCSNYMHDKNITETELKHVLPESVDQMGVKGMAHFYRAKIKAMQNEYDALQFENKTKCEEIKKVQKEVVKLTEEKDKWFQAYNTNKTGMSKLENQITTINSKTKAKENENAALRKEIEQLKRDLKNVTGNVSGSEVKLNRALEENEKLKSSLKTYKQEEKELKETHRKEILEITGTVKRLEKHVSELLSAFKRQMQLIDNLKKQKACLEASKLTQISENEFTKLLDWKIDA